MNPPVPLNRCSDRASRGCQMNISPTPPPFLITTGELQQHQWKTTRAALSHVNEFIVSSSFSHKRNCIQTHWDNLDWDNQNEFPAMVRRHGTVSSLREWTSGFSFGFSYVIQILIATTPGLNQLFNNLRNVPAYFVLLPSFTENEPEGCLILEVHIFFFVLENWMIRSNMKLEPELAYLSIKTGIEGKQLT